MSATAQNLTGLGFPPALADRIDNNRDGINSVNNAAPVTSYFSLNYVPQTGSSGTSVTASVTTEYLAEVFIPVNATITGLALLNGGTAAGNVTLTLYDTAGNLLAQTASTAQSGTNVLQSIPLTAPYAAAGPARYFVGASFNNATATFLSVTLGVGKCGTLTGQTYGTFPSPITAPTAFAANAAPIIGTY